MDKKSDLPSKIFRSLDNSFVALGLLFLIFFLPHIFAGEFSPSGNQTMLCFAAWFFWPALFFACRRELDNRDSPTSGAFWFSFIVILIGILSLAVARNDVQATLSFFFLCLMPFVQLIGGIIIALALRGE